MARPQPSTEPSYDDRLPRYQRLRDDLAAKIADRAWRPGDRLPAELDLAESYAVSPGTVRRAIGLLVEDGLLERRQGTGTFVRRASFDASLFRFFRFEGAAGVRAVPGSRLLRRDTNDAPAEVARDLRLGEGERVIHLLRLRLDGGQPFLVEEIWLPLKLFGPLLEMPLKEFPDLLYPLYEAACGQVVASAEEHLTAEAAAAPYAELLGIGPGSPIIVIDRVALGYDRQPLEWRRTRGRADKFRYRVEIR